MSAPDIAARLAADAENVCRYLLPNGVRKGREWKVGGVEGHAGESLGVVLSGSKAGQWADFSGDASGDMVGLWMACREVDDKTALREAEDFLGIERRPRTNGHVNGHAKPIESPEREVCIAPDDAPSFRHHKYGDPATIWTYRNSENQILGYVCRFDPAGERKQIIPRTYSLSDGWQWKGWNKPRPIYGLDRLAKHPAKPVLIVEGEKAADAASATLSAYAVIAWVGGCPGVPYIDWTPLKGRNVAIWPDADDAGRAAARAIAVALAEPVRMIDPAGMPDGWDVADAVAEGMTPGQIIDWCKARVGAAELYLPEHHALTSDYTPNHPDMIEDVPEPLDVFSTAPLPTLSKMQLPAAIGDYVFDQSEVIGSDPCILAIASLVATASLIHDDIQLQPKAHEYSWKESARLWGVVVGDPSTKKTPPIAKAVSHVKKIDIDRALSSAVEAEAYRIDMKIHAAIEKRHVEERSKGEKARSDLHPAPQRPPERRALVEDITIEKCAEVMADNPGGILALHDELSGWFGAMDAYRAQGNKDTPFWLRCYNGGSMRVDRKTAGSSILVPNVSACLLGGIQPEPMRAQASKMKDDGLLQRFMIVCARPADPFGLDRPGDREAIENYRRVQDVLSKAKGDPNNPLLFSDAARAVFQRAMQRAAAIERELDASPRLVAHAGKISGLFVRLCLTYHAMDCAYADAPIGHLVDESTARRVEAFIFDFLMGHIRYFYDTVLGNSTFTPHVRWIAGHILARAPEKVTSSYILKRYRAWERLEEHHRRGILSYLELACWLQPDAPDNRGQATRGWFVNPRVHELFKQQAVIELERIENAKKQPNINVR